MEKAIQYLEKLDISTEKFNPHLHTPCCGKHPTLVVSSKTKESYLRCECGKKHNPSKLVQVNQKQSKNFTLFFYIYSNHFTYIFVDCGKLLFVNF